VLEEAVQLFSTSGVAAAAVPRNRGSSRQGWDNTTYFTGDLSLDLILDLFLMANSDVLVGISSSNWVRLADVLRLGLGKGSQLLPLLDPFGVPYMEW
jgi:hypothetical protein